MPETRTQWGHHGKPPAPSLRDFAGRMFPLRPSFSIRLFLLRNIYTYITRSLDNEYYGIKAYDVSVTFVVNSNCTEFRQLLKPDVQKLLDAETDFPYIPFLFNVSIQGVEIIQITSIQAKLLEALHYFITSTYIVPMFEPLIRQNTELWSLTLKFDLIT